MNAVPALFCSIDFNIQVREKTDHPNIAMNNNSHMSVILVVWHHVASDHLLFNDVGNLIRSELCHVIQVGTVSDGAHDFIRSTRGLDGIDERTFSRQIQPFLYCLRKLVLFTSILKVVFVVDKGESGPFRLLLRHFKKITSVSQAASMCFMFNALQHTLGLPNTRCSQEG